MAASLRSARSVAKAVLLNRMGRIDYRLSERTLTVNGAFPFGKVAFAVPLSRSPRVDAIGSILARREPASAPWQGAMSTSERIWDNFLTERDKAVFAAGGFGARAGLGKRPALLVMDVNWA